MQMGSLCLICPISLNALKRRCLSIKSMFDYQSINQLDTIDTIDTIDISTSIPICNFFDFFFTKQIFEKLIRNLKKLIRV